MSTRKKNAFTRVPAYICLHKYGGHVSGISSIGYYVLTAECMHMNTVAIDKVDRVRKMAETRKIQDPRTPQARTSMEHCANIRQLSYSH